MRPATVFITLAGSLIAASSPVTVKQLDPTTASANNSIFNDVMLDVTARGNSLVDAIKAFQPGDTQALNNITTQGSGMFAVMQSAEQEMAAKGNLSLVESLELLPASIGVSGMVHNLAGTLVAKVADFDSAGMTSTLLPVLVEARDRTTSMTHSFDNHLPDFVQLIVSPFDEEMLDQLRNVVNVYSNHSQMSQPNGSA